MSSTTGEQEVEYDDFPESTATSPLRRREEQALFLLAEAGWSTGELSMCFEIYDETVRKIIRGFDPEFYQKGGVR